MTIKIEKVDKTYDVFDIKVEENENFYANGILVHNCQEITLPVQPITHIDNGRIIKKKVKVKKSDLDKLNSYLKNKKEFHIKNETDIKDL